VSNTAFEHTTPKVERGIYIVVSVLIKHRGVQAFSKHDKAVDDNRELAKQVMVKVYIEILDELGSCPRSQLEMIERCLKLARERDLCSYDKQAGQLIPSKRGKREKRKYIKALATSRASERHKARRSARVTVTN